MLAAFRKKLNAHGSSSHSLQSLSPRPELVSPTLQAKFSRGISTNMRILISGRPKSGKSSLLRRLKGQPYTSEYQPTTDPVSAVSVNWNYKATSDVIKVDAWEVKEDELSGYFQGSSAVIIIYHGCEPYELDFVIKRIPSIPINLPVLVVANFVDQDPTIDEIDVDRLVDLGSTRLTPIYFCKSSMPTGRGLNMIYQFFNVPYLLTKEQELNLSLENTRNDLSTAIRNMKTLQVNQFIIDDPPSPLKVPQISASNKDLQNNLVLEDEDEISDEEMLVNNVLTANRVTKHEDADDKPELTLGCSLQVRGRPVGRSPDKESLDNPDEGPQGTSSPALRAPLAEYDSPIDSTLGETSTMTIQSSPDDDEMVRSRNELDWSRNNFLASEGESIEK